MIFSTDDIHIILKSRNIEIYEHSSFLIGEIAFLIKFRDYLIVTIFKPT